MSSTQLSVLVNPGSTLAALLRKGKQDKVWSLRNGTKMDKQEIIIDPTKIKGEIKQILEELFKEDKLVGSLEKKGIVKVLRKIEAVLQEIIRDNPSNEKHYGTLVEEISKMVKDLNKSPKPYSSITLSTSASLSADDPFWHEVRQRGNAGSDLRAVYNMLNDQEKRCFSFLSSFFSTFPTPVEVNKRDLIHWWIGMELIDEPSEGKQVLAKLMAEDLLICPIGDGETTQSSRFTMPPTIASEMQNPDVELSQYRGEQGNRLFTCRTAGSTVAAINTNAYTLNAKIFDWVFRMRDTKVVHLGSWHHDMDYVVVEDMIIRALNDLKSLKEVRFFSLQGVSRLQVLPNSIYSLSRLKVLDLRACQDLRVLPEGIESLQELTHLDLSQCYELHRIPKGITSLSNLTVLKGFVIDPDSTHPQLRALLTRFKKRFLPCSFTELSKLQKLTKLTIRTRMVNFPRSQDLEDLCKMQKLNKLKITWVCSTRTSQGDQSQEYNLQGFPTALQKLELQAAPEATATRLLGLIGNRSHMNLKKLYIRGGGLWKLDLKQYSFPNVEVVRFRFLRKLHLNWYDFKPSFPKLTRLEIFTCPNLIFFPTDDNGAWEEA